MFNFKTPPLYFSTSAWLTITAIPKWQRRPYVMWDSTFPTVKCPDPSAHSPLLSPVPAKSHRVPRRLSGSCPMSLCPWRSCQRCLSMDVSFLMCLVLLYLCFLGIFLQNFLMWSSFVYLWSIIISSPFYPKPLTGPH